MLHSIIFWRQLNGRDLGRDLDLEENLLTKVNIKIKNKGEWMRRKDIGGLICNVFQLRDFRLRDFGHSTS